MAVKLSQLTGPSRRRILELNIEAPTSTAARQSPASGKQAEITATNEARNWMKRRWPNSIARMLPLGVGAGDEIAAEAEQAGIPQRAIRLALIKHTQRPAYLENMAAPNAHRVNLVERV